MATMYTVFGKDLLSMGKFKKLKYARKTYKKEGASMLASLRPSKKSFSGWTVKKVLSRK